MTPGEENKMEKIWRYTDKQEQLQELTDKVDEIVDKINELDKKNREIMRTLTDREKTVGES